MQFLRYHLLLLILLITIITGKSQTSETFIIQVESDTSIERIHEYFRTKNIKISSRLIAPSIGAYLIHPQRVVRRAAGWNELFDHCPDITAWQPNRTYEKRNRTPNDPQYKDQWYLETIRMPEAWEYTTGEVPDSIPVPVVGVLEAGYTMDREDFEDIFF